MLLNTRRSWFFDFRNGELKENYKSQTSFSSLKNWRQDPNDYYYLEFQSVKSFLKINPYSLIPPSILTRILDVNDNCFLALSNTHEGFVTNILNVIHSELITKHKIPSKKIVVFTGSFNLAKQAKEHAQANNYDPIIVDSMLDLGKSALTQYNFLIETGKRHNCPDTLKNINPSKKYICFNRRWRRHRPFLIALLKSLGILDQGYVSLGKADDGDQNWKSALFDIRSRCRENTTVLELIDKHYDNILSIPSLYLDTTDLVTNRADIELTPQLKSMYEESFFSVVNETHCLTERENDENTCFLSEKFFKPIILRHPFILVAAPYTLAHAKKLGFKSFSPFINEEYDTIEDDVQRLYFIANEIKRLCEWTPEQIAEFCTFAEEIVNYNYNFFKNMKEFTFRDFIL